MALPVKQPTEAGPTTTSWTRTNSIKEVHGRPIYCVSFNTETHQHADLFAAVGGNMVSVYRAKPKGVIEPVIAYVDQNADEEYFVCKWTRNAITGAPMLLIAGKGALMKAINCCTNKVEQVCVGHGDSINDIATHYKRPHLVVTASRDMSLRLWNLRTRMCVLVLAGEGGHRNEVLSVDFHPSNMCKLVSAGMDYSIKIWSLEAHESVIEESEQWTHGGDSLAFQLQQIHHPVFSTYKLHFNYVDWVRWYGDMVLSKSVDNRVLMWQPPSDEDDISNGYATVLQEYKFNDGNVWWMRFSVNAEAGLLVGGNAGSKIYVWNLRRYGSHPASTMTRPGGRFTVRQTSISWNGKIILASCDDGTVWRYDLRVGSKSKQSNSGTATAATPEPPLEGAVWPSGWSPELVKQAQQKLAHDSIAGPED